MKTTSTNTSTQHSKKARTLAWTGAALLLAGIVLYWAAEPLAKVYLSRDAHGSISTIDENRMDRIQNVGDKMSWLGLGLILVGAVAWVNRRQDEQEANKRVGSDGGPAPSSHESR